MKSKKKKEDNKIKKQTKKKEKKIENIRIKKQHKGVITNKIEQDRK